MLICSFCNKECINDNSLRNHSRLCKLNPNRTIPNIIGFSVNVKVECSFCNKSFSKSNIKRHEDSCHNNIKNIKECPVCNLSFVGNSTTCSYSCANTYFRSGELNGNWKEDSYRSTCFLYHKKECVICGECKIVTVHHMNGDHGDNRPENLVPLCPTHHQYFHSMYRNEVEQKINEYIENFKLRMA